MLDALKNLGFKVKPSANPKKKLSPSTKGKRKEDLDRVDKIRAMWIELGKQGVIRNPYEDALNAFVKRLTGVDRIEWLLTHKDWAKKSEAVIVALHKMAEKAGVELDAVNH